MFNEAEDIVYLIPKPVVKLFQKIKNFLCITWLFETKGFKLQTQKQLSAFSTSYPLSYGTWQDKTKSGIYSPNLFYNLAVVL